MGNRLGIRTQAEYEAFAAWSESFLANGRAAVGQLRLIEDGLFGDHGQPSQETVAAAQAATVMLMDRIREDCLKALALIPKQ